MVQVEGEEAEAGVGGVEHNTPASHTGIASSVSLQHSMQLSKVSASFNAAHPSQSK